MAKTIERKCTGATRQRVFAAAVRAVGEAGWSMSHTDAQSGTLSFSTGMSMRSWSGQNMTVTLVSISPDETQIVVGGKRDQKGNPFGGGGGQVFDWGEKEKIAREFFAALGGALEKTPEPLEPAPSTATVAEEIERLAALRDKGVLTEDEFVAAKENLLRQLGSPAKRL